MNVGVSAVMRGLRLIIDVGLLWLLLMLLLFRSRPCVVFTVRFVVWVSGRLQRFKLGLVREGGLLASTAAERLLIRLMRHGRYYWRVNPKAILLVGVVLGARWSLPIANGIFRELALDLFERVLKLGAAGRHISALD